MADAFTLVADIRSGEPKKFLDLVMEQATEKNALIQSGIIVPSSALYAGEGTKAQIREWKPLGGDAVFLEDGTSLETQKMSLAVQDARVLFLGNAWGASSLASRIVGDDPIGRLAGELSTYWATTWNKIAFATLKGVTGKAGSLKDISTEAGAARVISRDAIVETAALLGDAAGKLNTVVMHSAVYHYLVKQDAVANIPDSQGGFFQSYMGYRVIVDDANTGASGVYTTILAAPGAIGFADVSNPAEFIEAARNPAAGVNNVYSRNSVVLHPMGYDLTATVSGINPTMVQLGAQASWTLRSEFKNTNAVALKHTIVAGA